jgi:pimeloyl-ACP methyl ester carboxylesterase
MLSEARMFEVCPHHLRPQLRRVTAPRLVVRGATSGTLQLAAVARMGRDMPAVDVTELAGISHFPPKGKPDEVADPIRDFISAEVRG